MEHVYKGAYPAYLTFVGDYGMTRGCVGPIASRAESSFSLGLANYGNCPAIFNMPSGGESS